MLKKILKYTTALGMVLSLSSITFAQEEKSDKPKTEAEQKKVDELKNALNSMNIDLKTLKGDEVVAKVGNKTFTSKEVFEAMRQTLQAASQTMGPEFVKTLTPEILFLIAREQLIDIHLVDQEVEANKSRLEKQPEVKEAITEAIHNVLRAALMNEKAEDNVNSNNVRAQYEKVMKNFPPDAEEVRVRMIVTKSEDDAKKIIEQLDKGGDFLKLAREQSIDKKTAQNDGDLGYINELVAKSALPPEFAIIFEKKSGKPALPSGSYTKTPIKSPMGYHVLKVEDRRPLKKPKMSELEPGLKDLLRQEAVQKMQEDLKKKAGKIEYLHPNTGKPMNSLEKELKSIQEKLTGAVPDDKADKKE